MRKSPFLIVLLICCACRANLPEYGEHALTLSAPDCGEVFHVHYDQSHPGAYFQTDSVLVATLWVFSDSDRRTYRQQLKSANHALECSWILPEDAVFIRVSVSPPFVARSPENAAGCALKQHVELPGGIPWLMMQAESKQELMQLFVQDSVSYTQNLSRWPALISRIGKLGVANPELQNLTVRLRTGIDGLEDSNYRACFDAYTALAMAAHMLGRQQELDSCIHILLGLAEILSTENIQASLLSASVLSNMIFRDFQVWRNDDFSRDRADRVLQYIELAAALDNPYLQNEIMKAGFRSQGLMERYREAFTFGLEYFSNSVANWSKCELAANSDMPVGLALCSQALQDARFIPVLETQLKRLAEIPSWNPASPDECVDDSEGSGRIAMGLLSLARIHETAGDIVAEERILDRVLNTPGRFVEGAHSLAAVRLAKIFLNKNLPDSAELFYARAEHLGSPFAEEILDEINGHRVARGQQELDKMTLQTKYSQFQPPPLAEAIQGRIETLSGPVDYNSDEPLFLLFSSIDCSVCTEYMPGLYSELIESFPPNNVIVVTEDAPAITRRLYGEKVRAALLTRELAARHQIQMLPSIQVVRNNNIELKRASVSATTAKQLLHMFGGQAAVESP